MPSLSNVVRTFAKYPGFVLMRAVARFGVVRSTVVWAQSAMREPVERYVSRLRERPSEFFAEADPAALVQAVERDGFGLGLTLPTNVVEQILDFARVNYCWADRDPRFGFLPEQVEEARRKLGRSFLLAHYFNVRRGSPLIARLVEDPVMLEIAARYLGTVPKL